VLWHILCNEHLKILCSLLVLISKYFIIPLFVYRFEEASGLLTGLMNALSTKQWDKAKVYGECVREHFRTLLEDSVVK
jgi:hypothetical protein